MVGAALDKVEALAGDCERSATPLDRELVLELLGGAADRHADLEARATTEEQRTQLAAGRALSESFRHAGF